jgi:acyl carrier protein
MKLESLLELVGLQLGKKNVKATDHFFNDLNAESLDMVNLAAAVEDRFGIVIAEEVLTSLQTVQDLFDYLTAATSN